MKTVKMLDPARTFAAFVSDHGAEKIARCYFTPMSPMQDEELFDVFDDDGVLVAWAGMRKVDAELRGYRLGVFQAYERRGWRVQIREFLTALAFAEPETKAIRTSVQVANPPQVVRMLNSSVDGGWLEFRNATLEPRPTLWFYLTRERYEAKVKR